MKFTEKMFEEKDKLDFFDDNYQDELIKIAEEADSFKAVEMDQYKPDSEIFDEFVGKSVGDLMDEGYERTGSMISDNDCFFSFANDRYEINVRLVETVVDTDMAENYLRALTISSIEFTGFTGDFYLSFIE